MQILHFQTWHDNVRLMTAFVARAITMPKPRFSAWLALLVMFAVLLRAAIPVGFMPDLVSGQKFQMVICTMYGAKTVEVDGDFNPLQKKGDQKETQHQTPCDFSVNTAFVDSVPIFSYFPPALFSSLQISALWYKTPSVKIFFGNASSQAPPLFFYV